jgi:hypothetical protein
MLILIPVNVMGQGGIPGEMVGPVEGSFPQATIGNGVVEATLYLPDAGTGYYRGSRFDWSGVVGRLTYGTHNYAGQWFRRYDPRIHDAISGPVESFAPIGFDSARPGDAFLAIGIGTLRKPDDNPYRFSYQYEIIDGGRWTTTVGSDRVDFTHVMNDGAGHAYSYGKTVRLAPGQAVMLVEHRLRNTGTLPLATNVFNHNFFMLDGQPTGSGLSVTFPFALQPVGTSRGFGTLAEVRDNRIVYLRDLETGETVSSEFEGFGDVPSDYDIRMENRVSGAGMRITADRPISRLNYWSIRNTACPEPYIDVQVEPGGEFTWTISYELYTVAGNPQI